MSSPQFTQDPLPEALQCPICYNDLVAAMTFPCTHKVCAVCAQQMGNKCPICRTTGTAVKDFVMCEAVKSVLGGRHFRCKRCLAVIDGAGRQTHQCNGGPREPAAGGSRADQGVEVATSTTNNTQPPLSFASTDAAAAALDEHQVQLLTERFLPLAQAGGNGWTPRDIEVVVRRAVASRAPIDDDRIVSMLLGLENEDRLGGGGGCDTASYASTGASIQRNTYRRPPSPPAPAPHRRPSQPRACCHISVAVAAVLLVLFGLCLALLAFQKQLGSKGLLAMCTGCNSVLYAAYVAAGAVLLLGLLGAVAVARRKQPQHRCASHLFACCVLPLGVCLLAFAVFLVVFKINVHTADLQPLWRRAVANDPAFVCLLETNLRCSGFRQGCCVTNTTSVDLDLPVSELLGAFCYINLPSGENLAAATSATSGGATNASSASSADLVLEPVSWPSEDCVLSALGGCPDGSVFFSTCETVLHTKVSRDLSLLLLALGVLGAGLVGAGVCAVRMQHRVSEAHGRMAADERQYLLGV